MKYTGTTYRPPFEANSLLLQVTTGCSHNKCTFCTMYRNIPFEVENMEQIEKDLNEARHARRRIRRVFLVNGDAFVLSADKLKEIAKKIIEIIPEVETIAMYSSVKNIEEKLFLECLDKRDIEFFGLHPSNAIRVHGILSKDKEEMIEELEEGLREIPDKFLDRRSRRGAEGSVEDFLGID